MQCKNECYVSGSSSTEEVVEAMKQSLQFTQDSNGSFCFKLHNGKPRKLSKRDRTSSTYLTRDVAAALDRINTFPRLNKLYYVVDKSQSQHFENLFFVLRNILQWKQKQAGIENNNPLNNLLDLLTCDNYFRITRNLTKIYFSKL